MQPVKIKFCGITRVEDARAAARAGADAIGLNFVPTSKRCIDLATAAEICSVLPPFVSVVALLVDPEAKEVETVLEALPVDLLQFHGEEADSFCRQFETPFLKTISVRAELSLDALCTAYPSAKGLLLDTWDKQSRGGTGRVFDWNAIRGSSRLPLVIAGGLTADNVADAVAAFQPWAVDAASGIESVPGIKSEAKMSAFVARVREAELAIPGHRVDR